MQYLLVVLDVTPRLDAPILKLLCVFVQDTRLNCVSFSICRASSTSVDSISITRVYRHEICKGLTGVLAFLVVFVPYALLLLLRMLQLRSPAFAAACLPWICMPWPAMAPPRLARRLEVATAGSRSRPGAGVFGLAKCWRGPGRYWHPAGCSPALSAAAPARSPPLLPDASRAMQRPMAKAACWPATEVRLALALRHIRVIESLPRLLFEGRVYEHDAYACEISPEVEVVRAHTPREEDRHERQRGPAG